MVLRAEAIAEGVVAVETKNITKKSSGQFKASRFLRSKKARPFKLHADLGVICDTKLHKYML